jgi:hypothetical protein
LRRPRQFYVLSSLTPSPNAERISPTCLRVGRTLQLLPLALALIATGGCEKKTGSVIDSVGHPPVLLESAISPSSINSDSITVGGSRNADDLLSLSTTISARVTASLDNPVSYVRFSLKNPSSNQSISDGELLDNGGGADRTKGDGLFTGTATFQIKRVEIGVFRVEIHAEAQNGFQSNTAVAPLTVYRGNHPPALSGLDAPDTLRLANQTQLLTLRIKATDPDGLSDIARVIFNSYKPDGSASSGNPFQMFDDGAASHGDLTAGDGTYSLIITLPSATQTGTYTFEFLAFDRSNEASATIIHRVTVKQ